MSSNLKPAMLNEVLAKFAIAPVHYRFEEVTSGLLNKSYRVLVNGQVQYFLQQINHRVFDVPAVMHNITVVSRHFATLANPPAMLRLYPTHAGNFWLQMDSTYWRLYRYVDGATYQHSDNPDVISEAGRVTGQFLQGLATLAPAALKTTVKSLVDEGRAATDFHNINWRYEQFRQSLATGNQARIRQSQPLIKLVEQHIGRAKDIYHRIVSTTPLRAMHNDTKLSNIRFTPDKQNNCLVDYDTLMPGYLAFDYGDALRTIGSRCAEDDRQLQRVGFDLQRIARYTAGFGQAWSGIDRQEVDLLAQAVCYMPFLMGLRMLTDYLNGDVYYHTDWPTHNYDRAANQLTLYQKGLAELSGIEEITKHYFLSPNNYNHYEDRS